MLGSPILDVAIGLIFVYLLLSLIASAITEGVEGWMKARAGHLELGIRTLLHDLNGQGLARKIYEHPLIFGLYVGNYRPPPGGGRRIARRSELPSYIPTRSFAVALLDVVARGAPVPEGGAVPSTEPISLDGVRKALERLENDQVRRALVSALDMSQGSLARAQANIEAWYDSSMDRVSGWYKRETQRVLLALGASVAVVANVNTFALARHLYRDPAAREVLVSHAAKADTALGQSLTAVRAELNQLDLPIGWSHVEFVAPWAGAPESRYPWWRSIVEPLLGWAMTALAISLGAPFWFDLLNKFMVIRSTVKPHEKSPEEGSEDRRPQQPRAARATDVVTPSAAQPPGP
ncbi:MAG: hypothetical protein ACREMX_14125 [Gemmatimonadales bacterium]